MVVVLWASYNSLLPYFFKLLIDTVSQFHTGQPNFVSAMIWPAIGYVGISLSFGVTFRFYDFIILTFMPDFKRDIQQAMVGYLQGHSYRYFQDNFTGALSNKVSDLVRGMSEIVDMFMDTCLCPIFGVGFAVVMMAQVSGLFALIFGGWAVVFIGGVLALSLYGQRYSKVYSEARSTVTGKLVDSIGNMLAVRLFARRSFEKRDLLRYTTDMMAADRRMQWYLFGVRVFMMLSVTLMIGGLLWGLIYYRANGWITVGDFVLILSLAGRIVDYLWYATSQFLRFSQLVGTCQQALSIITQPHEVTDSPEAVPLNSRAGGVQFDSVTFAHGDSRLFEDLSVTIVPGTKVGLVGFSGAGKTSFINLLLRFFELESGRIMIDGQDISTVTQESLYQTLSVIPQDTSLFHRTLMENIRYGRLEATDEEVREASRLAHCDAFIEALPLGYDSLVGERGIKLSGGQRQRIAIARAILKQAPILVLDEATSALDSVTESQIQLSLDVLMQSCTTIVIAHRLSTLSRMDRLLVFDHGSIVQDGTHDTLVGIPGHYQRLWNLQANGFLPA